MSAFTLLPYAKKKKKPWGYEIIFTPPQLPRVGKIIFIKKGCRLSLQYHDQKEETICLISGKARIWLENKRGEVVPLAMKRQKGYTILRNQKHRLEGVEDTLLVEVSSPETGHTFRLEDDYGRGTEKLR